MLLLARAAAAQLGDAAKLPPPAAQKVDFARDIHPIFAQSCLRCHGPEQPKSNFRLTDRASAIKGGDGGVAIVVGQSAQSPLIHYVAQLVEDEVLLALPVAPRHERCGLPGAAAAGEQIHPFATLAALKGKPN